jgi:hypothetical protein
MGIDIKFDWDEDGFKRAVEKAAQSGFDERIAELQQKVQTMTCPTHGEHPQVTVVKNAALNSELSGSAFCCQEFEGTVSAYLASVSDSKAL